MINLTLSFIFYCFNEISNKGVFMKISLKMLLASALSLCTGLSQAEAVHNFNTEVIRQTTDVSRMYGRSAVAANKQGDILWIEHNGNYHGICCYWNKKTGAIKIDLNSEMEKNGYLPIYAGNERFGYHVESAYLDDDSNVFLCIQHLKKTDQPERFRKLGVWNYIDGFQLINIPEIDNVVDFSVWPDFIVVHGRDLNQKYNIVVLRSEGGLWPWQKHKEEEKPQECPEKAQETPISTPWDNLAIGKHGARLNLLCQLLCNTKEKAEKKTLVLMMEAEASHVYDVLEYERRKAQAAIDKAALEGKEDKQAREDYDRALNQITALKNLVKKLSKTSSRIFSLDFPSKNWGPK